MTTDEQARVPAGSSAGGQFAKGGGSGGSGGSGGFVGPEQDLINQQNKEWGAVLGRHKKEKEEAIGGSHELWRGTLMAHQTERENMAHRQNEEYARLTRRGG